MIMFVAHCDHPDCAESGPEDDTPLGARRAAVRNGWQRWRSPDDELLDLCPAHHRESKAVRLEW